jgi:hypothetical protein
MAGGGGGGTSAAVAVSDSGLGSSGGSGSQQSLPTEPQVRRTLRPTFLFHVWHMHTVPFFIQIITHFFFFLSAKFSKCRD